VGNRFVDGAAPRVAAAALDISLDQVLHHRVERDLWDLRTRRIIEEDERVGYQRGKRRAEFFNGKPATSSNGPWSFAQAPASRKRPAINWPSLLNSSEARIVAREAH
jgi:hypothetical protein